MMTSAAPWASGPKGIGVASRCASPGSARSTSSFVIPQRTVRQTGGGSVVVVVVVVVVEEAGGTVSCGPDPGPCSFFPQPAARTTPKKTMDRRNPLVIFMAHIVTRERPLRPIRRDGDARLRRGRGRAHLAAGRARRARRPRRPSRPPLQLLGAGMELP